MKPRSIRDFQDWFETAHTTPRSQVAMMTLTEGQETGPQPESHPVSDQVLLVLEGTLEGEVNGVPVNLTEGQFLVIPAGSPHRFCNRRSTPALTFNVYAPPAYPPETKG